MRSTARRPRLLIAGGITALALACGLAPLPTQAEPGGLTIGQTTVGHVFVDQAEARFTVDGSQGGARWVVIDDQGRQLRSGALAAGAVELGVPDLGPGYYTLQITDSGGAEASATFAMIPEWEGAKDPRFGLNTKFGLPEEGQAPVWDPVTETYDQGRPEYDAEIVPLLDQSGAGATRDTIAWNQFEPEERRYAGGPDWYDDYITRNEAIGAPTTVILSYGNKLYDVDQEGIGAAPYTEEGIQAYAEYARAVLERYPGEVDTVEVWNEYNGAGAPWNRGPCKADARCYYEMVKATYQVVKETHPEARVIGPAGVTIPYGWLEELFSYGALDYLDAVTVHPYGFPAPPETGYSAPSLPGVGLEARITQLQELIDKYDGGQPKPIWFTEIGWGSYDAPRGVSEDTQASYLVRSNVLSLAAGVDRVYWYSLRNAKVLPTGPGANWGLLRDDGDPLGSLAPKESYTAYATMTRQLAGRAFSERDEAPEGVRSYVFTDGGSATRVVWSPGGPQDLTMTADGPVTVTRSDGEQRELTPHDGAVYLSVGTDPVYVDGAVTDLAAASAVTLDGPDSAAAGSEVVVTASLAETQGRGARPVRVRIEGERLVLAAPPRQPRSAGVWVDVGAGVDTSPLEAAPEVRTRTVLADVLIGSAVVGWLATEIDVTS